MSQHYEIAKVEGKSRTAVEITEDDFTLIVEALAEIRDRKIELSAPVQPLMSKLKQVF
jgi:hypothetical protein